MRKRYLSSEESLEEKKLKLGNQEETFATMAASVDISSSSLVSSSEEEHKQQNEDDVITATNKAVDTLNRDKIIRLNTSALFTEENWLGIKEVLRLLAGKNEKIAAFYRDYQEITLSDLALEEKKYFLEILSNFKIDFILTKDNCSLTLKGDNLNTTEGHLSGLNPINEDGEEFVNLEDADFLLERGYKIQLSAQLISPRI